MALLAVVLSTDAVAAGSANTGAARADAMVAPAARAPAAPALTTPVRSAPAVEIAGFAVLPAATFGPGPASGQYDGDGRRAAAPRFAAQPVQGLSAVQPGPDPGTWWGLSDNGYGTRWNSFDFRLVIHLFAARPDAREVRVLRRIELHDPAQQFPWRLADENLAGRPLTGADVDPESLVVMPDGSFWIGDEIGPWLLHFSADGALLAPPVELPAELPVKTASRTTGEASAAGFSLSATTPAAAVRDDGLLRSASHPLVLAGRATSRIRASKGFESLAPLRRADGTTTLLAMLEGTVEGDPPGVLRLAEFDPATNRWSGRQWRYRMQDPAHAVAELAGAPARHSAPRTGVASRHFALIERDDLQGDAARFKQVLAIDLETPDDAGWLRGRPLVDLLAIPDPRGRAGLGPTFRLPYWTPEGLLFVDARTLLVVVDNNFPAAGGRNATDSDPTEWIWVRSRRASGFAGAP